MEGGRTIRRAFMQSHLRETAASGNYDVRMRATRRMIIRVVTLGRRKHVRGRMRTTLLTVDARHPSKKYDLVENLNNISEAVCYKFVA